MTKKTTKASNHLSHSGQEFTDYHLETADKIYTGIAGGNLKELSELIHGITDEDYLHIHFAFFDKYGFGYMDKVRSMAKDYYELLKYKLT